MRASSQALRLLLCASVKIWAELSEPSVSKQSACLLPPPPRSIDSVTRCVRGARVRRVVFVFGDLANTRELR